MRAFLLLSLVAAPAAAHEFWIEPATYRPDPDRTLQVRLRVGDGYPGETYPRNPKHLKSFALHTAGKRRDIPGAAGSDPAGSVRLDGPGAHLLGYTSFPSRIELPAEKFEAYLKEEGLEHVSRRRAERGESAEPGRELYARCCKALLLVPGGRSDGFDRILGHTLELVPERDPASVRAGEELPVRLLHEGVPKKGALVRAFPRDRGSPPLLARTDDRGRVRLRLPRGGVWMVSTIHMQRARPGRDVEWESLWASLTFRAPDFGKEKRRDTNREPSRPPSR